MAGTDAFERTNRQPWSPRFSTTARAVADAARQLGLSVPGFRSPPTRAGADRTVRRLSDGRCIVAVRAKGRSADAVLDDLIAGVLVANRLTGDARRTAQRQLLEALRPLARSAA